MGGADNSAFQLATVAWNKILQFNLARNSTTPEPPNRFIFHYTTVDGFGGIIGDNYLQATSAYFLNDSTEITYGCKILSRVLDA
jgi:hypothetical protein